MQIIVDLAIAIQFRDGRRSPFQLLISPPLAPPSQSVLGLWLSSGFLGC
ncbi:hypothetical protein [Nostoc sp. DSM 114167]